MYNVMDDFRAGRQSRQAAEEQNYIQQRRTVEDPYKDAEMKRVAAARQAVVDKNGVEFGDTEVAQRAQNINFDRELQPTKVKQGEATLAETQERTTGLKQDNEKQLGDEARAAGLRAIDLMEASPDPTKIDPAQLAAIGTDPSKFGQVLKMWSEAPDKAVFFKGMRDMLQGQETVTGTISGYDANGKPVTIKQGSRDDPGVMENFSAVDQAQRAATLAGTQATTEATRALANQRNNPTAGKGKQLTPEQRMAQQFRVKTLVNGIKGKIAEGARTGALMSEEQDLWTQTGAWFANNIPILSEAAQNIADPSAQVLRDGIKSGVSALLREYVAAMGIGVGSISSNFELQNVQQIINNAGSNAQAQMAAMEQVEMLLSDPAFEARVLAAEGQAQAAAAVAPIQSAVAEDRRADLASRYDLGGTD